MLRCLAAGRNVSPSLASQQIRDQISPSTAGLRNSRSQPELINCGSFKNSLRRNRITVSGFAYGRGRAGRFAFGGQLYLFRRTWVRVSYIWTPWRRSSSGRLVSGVSCVRSQPSRILTPRLPGIPGLRPVEFLKAADASKAVSEKMLAVLAAMRTKASDTRSQWRIYQVFIPAAAPLSTGPKQIPPGPPCHPKSATTPMILLFFDAPRRPARGARGTRRAGLSDRYDFFPKISNGSKCA